jgi:flagellar biosynthesis/type III secretory pathway protein FliH
MSVITIPIASIAVPAPPGSRIAAAELANYAEANDIIEQARQTAQSLHLEAQQHLEQVQQQCEEARQNAWQEGLQLLKQETPALRQQLTAEVIHWLIDEQQLEQAIVTRLETQLRELLVSVFSGFIADQNLTDLLVLRLKERLEKVSHEHTATLHVCPQQYDELTLAFADYRWLQVKNDTTLLAGEAMLTTPLFTVYINLEEQLQAILARLAPPAEEPSL